MCLKENKNEKKGKFGFVWLIFLKAIIENSLKKTQNINFVFLCSLKIVLFKFNVLCVFQKKKKIGDKLVP